MRLVFGLLALAGGMHGASIGSSVSYSLNCVYLAGPSATPVTVTTMGATGSGSCPSTAQVLVGGATYTGNLSGNATATATASVVYGDLSIRSAATGSGLSGINGSSSVLVSFNDQLEFFGAGNGIAGFELAVIVSATRLDASTILTPSIIFMLNNVTQLPPVVGYPGAPGQPGVGRVNGAAANVAYYTPYFDSVKIPFSLTASIAASSGAASLADLALEISMQIRLYTPAGQAVQSCSYASDSLAPYAVLCALPEPGSAGLLGAGLLCIAALGLSRARS